MKKLSVIIIGLISIIPLNVGCQDNIQNKKNNNGQKQQLSQMNQKLKTELNLSDSQEKQWDEIQLKYRGEFKELRQESVDVQKEKIEKGKAITAEMDKEMLTVLDENQKETYKKTTAENRDMMRAKHQNRWKNNSAKNSFYQMKNELSLSESQTQKWDAIQTEYKPKFMEIRKSGQPGSEETRKEMLTMIEKKNTEILAILNADQQSTYSGFVEERKQLVNQRQGKK
jgi:hypothetical protein